MIRKICCFILVTALLGLCLYAYATAEEKPIFPREGQPTTMVVTRI